jgi:hypothetical protein
MNMPNRAASPNAPALTNGSGAAAILAAGIGCFALAVLACAGDKLAAVKNSLIFYKPTGPLSGRCHPDLACLVGYFGMALAEPDGRRRAYRCYCSRAARLEPIADVSARR